ncbi:WGxxGxxG family protein [Lysobacter sp. HA18]
MKKTIFAAAAATLMFGATVAPVMAQNTGTGDTATNDDTNRVAVADTRDDHDDGFDWGLLGLLGLAGLIPRKQRTVVHHDTVRTNTNTTTPR